jgi:hypothetical protein
MRAVNENETKRDGRAGGELSHRRYYKSYYCGLVCADHEWTVTHYGLLICSPFKRCRSQTEKNTMPREPPHGNLSQGENDVEGGGRGGVLKEIRLT